MLSKFFTKKFLFSVSGIVTATWLQYTGHLSAQYWWL